MYYMSGANRVLFAVYGNATKSWQRCSLDASQRCPLKGGVRKLCAASHCTHHMPDCSGLSLSCCLLLCPLQLGPLRALEGTAEIAGCLSAAGLVLILATAMSIYGSAQFQSSAPLGVKTLSGRSVQRDPLQSAEG